MNGIVLGPARPSGERSAADTASEWKRGRLGFAFVQSLMHHLNVLSREFLTLVKFSADLALEGSIVGVGVHVVFQITFSRLFFPTNVTFEISPAVAYRFSVAPTSSFWFRRF